MTGRPSEGLDLRTGWFGRAFVPFDEMASFGAGVLTLASGETHRLPPPLHPEVERALSPPEPAGTLQADANALSNYVAGSWSPVRAASALLAMATAVGASDIHLEAGGDCFTARLRLAGDLVEFVRLPLPAGTRLVAALKHVAGCLPYRSDLVQEGRIPRAGVAADVRASFMPTAFGERVALRLFGKLLGVDRLGLDPSLRARLENVLERRSGLLLLAGPSGGGKTTTLYAALGFLAAHRRGAHLSLEDPVEQRLRLAGVPVDQVELCPDRGLTAEVALTGALRQDVDVLAVGEIRTAPEAALALKAAHTGRLVLAGVHAGSALEARRRLLDLDADAGVLTDTLLAVLHQRLEAVPCRECGGPACHRCRGIGRTRVPVAELVEAPW